MNIQHIRPCIELSDGIYIPVQLCMLCGLDYVKKSISQKGYDYMTHTVSLRVVKRRGIEVIYHKIKKPNTKKGRGRWKALKRSWKNTGVIMSKNALA